MLSDEEFHSLGYTFIWKIENFSYCLENKGSCIKSPDFVMKSSEKYETGWYLEVYPRGNYSSDFIGYCLCKIGDYGVNCINLDFELSIVASDGSLMESMECENVRFHQGTTYSKYKYIAQDELFGKKKQLYLPHDTLTFHCRMWDNGRVRSWLGQGFARTHISIQKRSVIWTIDEFDALQLGEDKTFVITSSFKEKLSLRLYLTFALDCDKKIRIEISETDTNQENLACFKIALVDSNGCLEFPTTDDHLFKKKEGIQAWNFPTSIPKSTLLANKNLYLFNNTLSLQCDCVFSIGVVYSELENSVLGPYTTPHVNFFMPEIHQHGRYKESGVKVSDSLKADLLNLYSEKTLCDFELRSGSETFSVHKTVLGARSPVFRAMISSDMIEKNINVVEIPDLDGETVKRMLHFMYTDSIEDLQWEDISKLYFAADKYGMLSLKQKCSLFFVCNLCAANVCEALELGDLHQDNALKAATMEFIFHNYDKIIISDEWMQFVKFKGQLAAETMHSVCLKKMCTFK